MIQCMSNFFFKGGDTGKKITKEITGPNFSELKRDLSIRLKESAK